LRAASKVDSDRWSRVPERVTSDRTVRAIEARKVRVVAVSGANRIVPSHNDALPLEGQHIQQVYGTSTELLKIVVLVKEMAEDHATLIMVGKRLGHWRGR
jgi:hypothetical protein